MFNENIKTIFINEKMESTTLDNYFLGNLFKKTAPFEEELGKDICNFTTKEIENMYKTMDFRSFDSLIIVNAMLSQYVVWAMSEGMVNDSQNHFREFNRSRLTRYINKVVNRMLIVPRETVIGWCDRLHNPSDAFLILGLFEGIRGKGNIEFFSLEEDDIDPINKTIYIRTRNDRITVSEELCRFGIAAAKETEYEGVSGDSLRVIKLAPCKNIIKPFPNWKDDATEPVKARRILGRTLRILNSIGEEEGERYNPSTIVNSGMLDMIERGSEKFGISKIDYVRTHLNEIERQYNKKIVPSKFIYKFNDFLE